MVAFRAYEKILDRTINTEIDIAKERNVGNANSKLRLEQLEAELKALKTVKERVLKAAFDASIAVRVLEAELVQLETPKRGAE